MSAMRTAAKPRRQCGAALIVGLIMLVLITVIITSTFTLSSANLRAVGNMQFRDEAVAAGNRAIELVISSPFTAAPAAQEILVDINNDGVNDYDVQFAAPVCVSAGSIAIAPQDPSSQTLPALFNQNVAQFRESLWDLAATVTDINFSGATVEIHQGLRVLLTQAEYIALCS